MGAITSRQVTEIQKEDKVDNIPTGTPKNSKILPFDPRSPSENVTRTPIAIMGTPKTNQTPSMKLIKALPIDPRSPTTEITRTPLFVEETSEKKKHPVLKPTKLAEFSFRNGDTAVTTKDPRSPTEKVPRTPLEDQSKKENPTSVKSTAADPNVLHSRPEKDVSSDHEMGSNMKLVDASVDSDRRPLTDLQNRTQSNSASRLQPQNIEEELSKQENLILNQMEGQDLTAATDFVESI